MAAARADHPEGAGAIEVPPMPKKKNGFGTGVGGRVCLGLLLSAKWSNVRAKIKGQPQNCDCCRAKKPRPNAPNEANFRQAARKATKLDRLTRGRCTHGEIGKT